MSPMSENRYMSLMAELKKAFEEDGNNAGVQQLPEVVTGVGLESLQDKRKNAIDEINELMRRHGITAEMLLDK